MCLGTLFCMFVARWYRTICWRHILLLHWAPISNAIWLYLKGSIPGLSILFHWSTCLLPLQYGTILITVALQSWSQVMSLLQICSSHSILPTVLNLLPHHSLGKKIDIHKITCWDFDKVCIECIDQVRKNWHLDNTDSS